MNPRISRILLTMALAATLAPATLLAQQKLNKTFTGIKNIRMNTASGNCAFRKSTDTKVTVNLTYSFGEDDYEPVITQDGDQLVIKEKFHGHSSRGSADWILTVPDNLKIEFTTGSGNVDATDLVLKLKATTGSGNYDFIGVSGELKLNTGSGHIELENTKGIVDATSGSGHFKVSKCSGEMTLTTGSGNPKLADSKGSFRVTTGSGNITGSNISVDGSSSFTTGSGDAEVALASTLQHDLAITSGSGDAVLNFNGNEIKGEIVMKASKKHGEINAPFAFDKTEELSQGRDEITVQKTVVKGSATPHISISTGSGDATLKK